MICLVESFWMHKYDVVTFGVSRHSGTSFHAQECRPDVTFSAETP
jgi:hypothetical protein